MQVCEIPVLQNYSEYFQPKIQDFREGKYIQIIILRETKSYTVFTLNGKYLHIERTPAGIEIMNPIDRAIMYEFKQLIPERLTGRGLLRQFDLYLPQKEKDEKSGFQDLKCDMACQSYGICPDCLLYGPIVTPKDELMLQQRRVLADSGFLVRGLPQVIRNLKFSDTGMMSGDITNVELECENLMPEVFIPTVETLVDVTKEEFVYIMGNILKTTRYGKGGKGFIRNHIVGVYFSDMEVFSNLEMSQSFYDIMSVNSSFPENLGLRDFIDNFIPVANECIKRSVGRITMLTDNEISELLHDVNVIYSDQEYLMNFIKGLSEISYDYVYKLSDPFAI